MLSDCKLKELFLVEQLPEGSCAIYDCDQDSFGMFVTKDGGIKRVDDKRIRIDMADEKILNDDLLCNLIRNVAITNRCFESHEIQLGYAVRDLPLTYMLTPDEDVDLERVFGNEYYIANVMETELAQVKPVVCEYLPKGEVIFLPNSEYFSRIALGNKNNFGAIIFNPKAPLRCRYI